MYMIALGGFPTPLAFGKENMTGLRNANLKNV